MEPWEGFEPPFATPITDTTFVAPFGYQGIKMVAEAGIEPA